MSLISTTGQAGLKRSTVRAAIGAAFHFDDGVQRYLASTEPRVDPAGNIWRAGSTLVQIDGIQFGVGRRTQPVTLTVAGLNTAGLNAEVAQALGEDPGGVNFFALALSQASLVRGRRVEFFLHQWDDEWAYIESPTSLGVYMMDQLSPAADGAQQTAAIKLTCEPILVSRFRAPNSYLCHEDQQARHPGDGALAFMAAYVVNQALPPW